MAEYPFFGLKCIGDFYLKVQNIVFYDNEGLDLMTKTSKQEKLSRALKTLWKHFVNQVLTLMSLKLQIFLKPNESSMNKFHGDLNIETFKKCFFKIYDTHLLDTIIKSHAIRYRNLTFNLVPSVLPLTSYSTFSRTEERTLVTRLPHFDKWWETLSPCYRQGERAQSSA